MRERLAVAVCFADLVYLRGCGANSLVVVTGKVIGIGRSGVVREGGSVECKVSSV